MSRRINFSRRGELIVGQTALSSNQPPGYGAYSPAVVNENSSNLENMRYVPPASTHEKYTTFMSTLGSTKESILSSSGFGPFGQSVSHPSELSANGGAKTYLSKPSNNYGEKSAGLGMYAGQCESVPFAEKNAGWERNSQVGLPDRVTRGSNQLKLRDETVNSYAPYYNPARTGVADPKPTATSLTGFDSQLRQTPGDFSDPQSISKSRPQYAFPSNYKFDFKSYDNYRRPSVSESQTVKESELAYESAKRQDYQRSTVGARESVHALLGPPEDVTTEKSKQKEMAPKLTHQKSSQIPVEALLADETPQLKETPQLEPFRPSPPVVPHVEAPIKVNPEPVQPTPEAEAQTDLYECYEGCGRMFSKEALKHHEKICKKIFQSKRKVFNSQLKRIQNEKNAAENGAPVVLPQNGKTAGGKPNNKKTWEKQSSQLRAEMQRAKGKKENPPAKQVREIGAKKPANRDAKGRDTNAGAPQNKAK